MHRRLSRGLGVLTRAPSRRPWSRKPLWALRSTEGSNPSPSADRAETPGNRGSARPAVALLTNRYGPHPTARFRRPLARAWRGSRALARLAPNAADPPGWAIRLTDVLGAPPTEVEEHHLQALVENGVREDADLDFKQARYGNGEQERRAFAGDIAAMAHDRGGLIVSASATRTTSRPSPPRSNSSTARKDASGRPRQATSRPTCRSRSASSRRARSRSAAITC